MDQVNIPDFISLVAGQIRESVRRFQSSGRTAILYLNGLQLHIAFTAEKSTEAEGGVELKPWIFSAKAGEKESVKDQVLHSVSIALSVAPVVESPPPFTAATLTDSEFSLLLEVAREIRTHYQGAVFVGPDTELIPPFPLLWRASAYSVEVRRRLAKQLVQNVDALNSLSDVTRMYDGALADITFVPAPPGGYAPPPPLPGVGFK